MFPVSIRELNGCTSQHLFVVSSSVSVVQTLCLYTKKSWKSTGNDKRIQNICFTLKTVKHDILFTSSQKKWHPNPDLLLQNL